jgi:integrase/recombinase XerD
LSGRRDAGMTELSGYRQQLGFTALPSPAEDTPLVMPVGQSRRPLTHAACMRSLRKFFAGAANRLRGRGRLRVWTGLFQV